MCFEIVELPAAHLHAGVIEKHDVARSLLFMVTWDERHGLLD